MRCPHFQYVCGWYEEGDQPFSQEFNHSYLKLWEDFLDRLECCLDVWGLVLPRVLLLFVWHIRQQSRAGTIWRPTGLVSPYL